MATVEEIKARARVLLAQDLPDQYREGVSDEDDLSAEGGVDSLGFIQVLTKLEAEFGAHVPDSEWWNIHTLDDLANAIVSHPREDGQTF